MYCWRGFTWLIFIHYDFIQRYDSSYVIFLFTSLYVTLCNINCYLVVVSSFPLLISWALKLPSLQMLFVRDITWWLSSTKCTVCERTPFFTDAVFFYSGCYGERHISRAKTGCSKHRETNCTQHVVLKRHWGIASSAVLTQTTESKLAVGRLVGHFVRMA